MENPVALELRRLQMLTEIGAENNTTTVVMMPSDFLTLTKRLSDSIQVDKPKSAQQEDGKG